MRYDLHSECRLISSCIWFQHRDEYRWWLNDASPGGVLWCSGDAGTGKSTVIHAISTSFEREGKSLQLVKTAHSGVASVLIKGTTICRLFHLLPSRVQTAKDKEKYEFSAKEIQRLVDEWKQTDYIIIDEISQVCGHADSGS